MKDEADLPFFDSEGAADEFYQLMGDSTAPESKDPKADQKPHARKNRRRDKTPAMPDFLEVDHDSSMDSLLDLPASASGISPASSAEPPTLEPADSSFRMEDMLEADEGDAGDAGEEECEGAPVFELLSPDDLSYLDQRIQQHRAEWGRVEETRHREGVMVRTRSGKNGLVLWQDFPDPAQIHVGDRILVDYQVEDRGPIYRFTLMKWEPQRLEQRERKTAGRSDRGAYQYSSFVIDGSNLSRLERRVSQSSSLRPVLAVVSALLQHEYDFVCVFDASEPYSLKRNKREKEGKWIYRELLCNHSTYFRECPGGSEADQLILQLADRTGAAVISNDRFHKPGENYHVEYPWLDFACHRLVRVELDDGALHLNHLGLRCPLPGNLYESFEDIEQLLNARGRQR
ncbi:MAG: hypothetical protein D6820_06905 [Lentisphaerae bacterium]|nr:MAG: hypothetical protein D6820_06905 [Lentisphaerota bacterium]